VIPAEERRATRRPRDERGVDRRPPSATTAPPRGRCRILVGRSRSRQRPWVICSTLRGLLLRDDDGLSSAVWRSSASVGGQREPVRDTPRAAVSSTWFATRGAHHREQHRRGAIGKPRAQTLRRPVCSTVFPCSSRVHQAPSSWRVRDAVDDERPARPRRGRLACAGFLVTSPRGFCDRHVRPSSGARTSSTSGQDRDRVEEMHCRRRRSGCSRVPAPISPDRERRRIRRRGCHFRVDGRSRARRKDRPS